MKPLRPMRSLHRHLGYLDETVQEKKSSKTSLQNLAFLHSEGWSRVGEYTFHRKIVLDNPLNRYTVTEELNPDGCPLSDVLFFDTETTGLSAGAGNLIFLLGFARIKGNTLECEQLFLSDYPGENEFLILVQQRLNEAGLFVSYNGKSFDSHILRMRFILNGMHCDLEHQNDLLYWARRFWRRHLKDCSLANIEREILGIHRTLDIPGVEVPVIYFEYLRTGREGRLPFVFAHNLQDIISLVKLFALLDQILKEEKIPEKTDMAALGSYLMSKNDPRGAEILEESFAGGDKKSGIILGLFYKRAGKWYEAVRLWKDMAVSGSVLDQPGSSPSYYEPLYACIELAKYYEHRRKDPGEALFWVHKILSGNIPCITDSTDLSKRKQRLEGKLKRRFKSDNN